MALSTRSRYGARPCRCSSRYAWTRAVYLSLLAVILLYGDCLVSVAFSPTSLCAIRQRSAINLHIKQHHIISDRIDKHDKSYRWIRTALNTPIGTPIGSTTPIDLGGAEHDNHSEITMTKKDNLVLASIVGGMIFIFWRLIHLSGPGSWRYYLAGGICAATSHAIPTPIDVVKTRKQVDTDLQGKSFLRAAHEISRKEGVHALLAGLGPTTFGYLLEGAVKFGVYEALKPVVKTVLAGLASASNMKFFNSQLIAFMLSGGVAGTAASIMLCPMEALRIRLVSEPNFAPGGWLEGGYKMAKNEGINGLFKGVKPMIQKQVPYTITKNVSFDYLTKLAYAFVRAQGLALSSFTLFLIPFTSALIASILSAVTSQPGDMLLSLVNAHEGKKRTRDFAKEILRSELGVRGFFVGMQDRLLHCGVIVTLQLLIYDFVKRLCGIAATGSC